MIDFEKQVEKMPEYELRAELTAIRKIINDIHNLTNRPQPRTLQGMTSVLNQVAHYCRREMPK